MTAPRTRLRDGRYPVTTVVCAAATLLHLLVWLGDHSIFKTAVVVAHIVGTVAFAVLTWRNRR